MHDHQASTFEFPHYSVLTRRVRVKNFSVLLILERLLDLLNVRRVDWKFHKSFQASLYLYLGIAKPWPFQYGIYPPPPSSTSPVLSTGASSLKSSALSVEGHQRWCGGEGVALPLASQAFTQKECQPLFVSCRDVGHSQSWRTQRTQSPPRLPRPPRSPLLPLPHACLLLQSTRRYSRSSCPLTTPGRACLFSVNR
jgi:hypothetical protein